MICNTCKTEVPASFEHAIANNQCPKCGSQIMSADKMEAFKYLKKDLGKLPMSMNAEETLDRIVTHLIHNYQIRPLTPVDMSDGPPMTEQPSISNRQPTMPTMPNMGPNSGNPGIEVLKQEVYREMREQQQEAAGVRSEGLPMANEAEGVVWDSGDEGNLVERLKAKAKGGNKFINKQGTRVKRLD